MKPTRSELDIRQFTGNGDVLCSFSCPFCKVVNSTTAFCTLFKTTLSYVDTGNNELCDRCSECLRKDNSLEA